MKTLKLSKKTATKEKKYVRPTRVRNFTFTDNNEKHELKLYDTLYSDYPDVIRYVTGGYEIAPKTGHKHIQGWIQVNIPKTISQIKKLLPDGDHIEVMIKSEKINDVYCHKDGKTFQHGTFIKQGQRTDIEQVMNAIKHEKRDMAYVLEKWPCLYVRYYKAFERARKIVIKQNAMKSLKLRMSTAILRDWQIIANSKIDTQNDRKVLWVVDPIGNNGKSYLAKYLVGTKDAFYVRGGKSADISYNYNYEKIVCFDFTRDQCDRINYQIIEDFKDGMIFSPKYESETKIFDSAKVVVFSNFYPDTTKLSSDRWDIMTISTKPFLKCHEASLG